jgi:hypothetical protein
MKIRTTLIALALAAGPIVEACDDDTPGEEIREDIDETRENVEDAVDEARE